MVTDVSGVGRCSALVVLPVLALSGFSSALLPTAYFSTHTGGFGPVHRLDMTGDMAAAIAHWQRLGLRFDAVYLSYVAAARQLTMLEEALPSLMAPEARLYVDPVMGDQGKPYSFCGEDLIEAFRRLCARADVIFPNRTEAALLLGQPLAQGQEPPVPPERDLLSLVAKNVVLTGVSQGEDRLGVLAIGEKQPLYTTFRQRHPGHYPGTGDLLAASLIAALLRGKPLQEACEIACDFLDSALRNTLRYGEEPRFGLAFEDALPSLADHLGRPVLHFD